MFEWKKATGGSIPDGAAVVGQERDGQPLFAARAEYDGALHPGEVRQEFGAANIPWAGIVIKVNPYEVLAGETKWVQAANGAIPMNAVVAGHEGDGKPLYVARAKYEGGIHIGKVRPGYDAANIPYAGTEVKVASYEVLVAD